MKINPIGTYKVTCTMYLRLRVVHDYEAHFRWYWQANAYSWLMHHVMGYRCNTWRKT